MPVVINEMVIPYQATSPLAKVIINSDEAPWQTFKRLTGRERLSELFEYRLELEFPVLADGSPPGDNSRWNTVGRGTNEWVGKDIEVQIPLNAEAATRKIRGRIAYVETEMGTRVVVTIVPKAWRFGQNRTYWTYEDQSTLDIVRAVLGRNSASLDVQGGTGAGQMRKFTMQFGESDWRFISRLLDDEGIHYFFPDSGDGDAVTVTDSVAAHTAVSGYEKLPYVENLSQRVLKDSVWGWRVEQQLPPKKFKSKSHDYTNASDDSHAERLSLNQKAEWEVYEYPGPYVKADDGTNFARARMEEKESGAEVVSGSTQARGLYAGALFTLEDAPRTDQNREYLVVGCEVDFSTYGHEGTVFEKEQAAASGPGQGGLPLYMCRFEAIASDVPYRPMRRYPRPQMLGPLTAVVMSNSDPDQTGRVQVKFYWGGVDNEGDGSTAWLRVAMPYAGKDHGFVFTPQADDEVVVDFEDGDPDRPLVVGAVYNSNAAQGVQQAPTESIIKTPAGNEIHIWDDQGSEKVRIYSPSHVAVDADKDIILTAGQESMKVDGVGMTVEITSSGKIKITGMDIEVTASGKFAVTASEIDLTGAMIKLDGAMVQASGVVQCQTIIATSVVGTSYTPGAGNIW